MSQYGTQAIDRAAELLTRVMTGDEPVTFTQLCDETGYPRSTTSRIMCALERHRLVRRRASGGWMPGPVCEQYAAGIGRHDRLIRLATPTMESLGALTRETVHLGAPLGRRVEQIAQVDSAYLLGSRDWVGVDIPPHASALGKVLYAFGALPTPTGALERLTERTVSTGRELSAQFDEIHRQGYALTRDELEDGLTGIAAPLIVDGQAVAALGLSGPTSRLAEHIPSIGATVVAEAAALSARLGNHRKEGAA